jgi:alkaline phosphatase D
MRLILILLLFISLNGFSQARVISGPMLGPVEIRDAKVWVEVSPEVRSVSIQYNQKGTAQKKRVDYKGVLGNEFNPVSFTIGGLEFNTTYQYSILINGKASGRTGEFTTKDLWQWRKPAPDFSFLAGSCSYFNEPVYDRPGTPYGKDSSIFETMAKERASFMLWLGDAWYTREVDYYSEWGLWYRASRDRSIPVLQKFLASMPQLAIWDDHDFGPNNAGGSYILKETSRKVFTSYFINPSAGENGEGIYTMYSWGDVDIFMTDDRWWRSADWVKDTIDGKLNPDKIMFGRRQLDWLKNSLLYSNAPFKLVAVGSQVLNPVSPYDKLKDFSLEYKELMNFLAEYRINGVVFITGDRHHSEIIKVDRQGLYPLYDITCSPLTSGTHVFGKEEQNNPFRIFGLDQKQNYTRFSFSGARGSRQMKVDFLGVKGEALGTWSIDEKDLKNSRQ